MKASWLRPRVALVSLLAVLGVLFAVTPVLAGSTTATGRSSERAADNAAEGQYEVLEAAEQYAEARTAPGDTVDSGAFSDAYLAAKNLPVVGGGWSEITTKPYDSDAQGYRDPVWSNSGGGAAVVSGRVTALANDGSTIYVGTADGGVWKKGNKGGWKPLLDDSPTLSIGSVAVNSDHSVWVGTGEANTSSDSYAGIGVLRSTDGGANWSRVGGNELANTLIGKIVFSGDTVFAATSKGLWKRSASNLTAPWTRVLYPASCPQAGATPDTRYISDVAVQPGTNGRNVVAVVGWRAGSVCNGFYFSTDGGNTFTRDTVTGSINDQHIGRVSLGYSGDGSKLYAVVQDSSMFNQLKTDFGGTELMGIFVSKTGNPAGPWNTAAEWKNLENSGSALHYLGFRPGIQAWYNQYVVVDPNDANHVYVGLEEVFETTDGGLTWKAIGPYWNFGMPCAANGLDSCGKTTHPDQHAGLIANGVFYAGNDGGVYSRSLSNHVHDGKDWTSLNSGLNTLQYYYADAGPVSGGDAIWGGLQDNGVSLLSPGASTMVSPFGGDGGDNIVDHSNGDRAVNEYVGLDMALTTNGGRSDGSVPAYREITPACGAFTYTPSPCDPLPRFIAPFEADSANPNHWVAGGEYVWDNQGKGWDTHCGSSSCDWKIQYDTGAGHSITQIAVNGSTYVAWCGPCNGSSFQRGIATNYNGSWHAVSTTGLPRRFIQGLTVDPANPAHVYVVFSGFSRRWTSDAGYGHVFETTNGGASWTDISGNIPDAPGDDLVLTSSGKLVVATDIGVFIASAGQGTATNWSRFGSGLPNASTNDLQLSPNGSYIIAATHGRGLWKIATP